MRVVRADGGQLAFILERVLGSGAMGTVYEAVEEATRRRVALKTIKSTSPDALLRFKREFRAVQGILHPNLVSLGELLTDDRGCPFFTMEFVNGVDVITYIRPRPSARPPANALESTQTGPLAVASKARPYDETRLRSAFSELAVALVALHQRNCLHRDIKPSNVLVDDTGRVVVLDFGLITDTNTEGQSTGPVVVGTPAYMAPEQAAGQTIDTAADWYAFGVVLFEALTGVLPVSGSALQIMQLKQRDRPVPARELADVPADLDELCRNLLEISPAARPTGEEVLRRLGHSQPIVPEGASQDGTCFVGRRGELDLLHGYADQVTRDRRAKTVVIVGESGLGKTVLARRFSLEVLEEDGVILHGQCYERELIAYKAFDGVIDALARYMSRLDAADAASLLPRGACLLRETFPALSIVPSIAAAPEVPFPSNGLEKRQVLFDSLRELFARLTDRRRVVFIIDDLQWADDDSLALLKSLVCHPESPPLLLLATARTTTVGIRALRAELIQLGPLPDVDARELASQLLAPVRPDTAVAAAVIADEADGHPLFITELVRHASAPTATSAPLRLTDAIEMRIATLDVNDRAALELVCVAGSRLRPDVVADALDLARRDVVVHLKRLGAAAFVRTVGAGSDEGIEAIHDRIRETVLDRIPAPRRGELHGRLARALQSTEVEPEVLAHHLQGAGRTAEAAAYLLRAAEKASANPMALGRTVELLTLLLSILPGTDERRHDIKTRLADALANAGRSYEAAAQYIELANAANVEDSVALQAKAAQQFLFSGRVSECLVAIGHVMRAWKLDFGQPWRRPREAVLRRWTMHLLGSDKSQAYATDGEKADFFYSLVHGFAFADWERVIEFSERALHYARRSRDTKRLSLALSTQGGYLAIIGTRRSRKRAERVLQEAQHLAERARDEYALDTARASSAVLAFESGHWIRALQLADTVVNSVRENGLVAWNETVLMQLIAGRSLAVLGRFKDLHQRIATIEQQASSRGHTYSMVLVDASIATYYWLSMDRPDLAVESVKHALERGTREQIKVPKWLATLCLAECDLYAANGRNALTRLLELVTQLDVRRVRASFGRMMTDFALARAAVLSASVGDTDQLQCAEDAISRLEQSDLPAANALANIARGGVSSIHHANAEAVEHLSTAERQLRQCDMDFHAACVQFQIAAFLPSEEAAQIRDRVSRWMRTRGVTNVPSMARTVAPTRRIPDHT